MPDQSSAATEHAILQEITRPLESLPDDPLAVVDADFPTALRGYDRLAVDEYVRQTRRLVAELQSTRSPEAAVRRALERVGEQISGILQRAHETAEQITAQSRSEAEDRLMEARQEAQDIVSAAEQRVRDLDSDTDRIWLERQRIVADAEDLASQLLAVARTAGERFPADAGVDSGPVTYDTPDAPGVPAAQEPEAEDDGYVQADPYDREDPHAGEDPYAGDDAYGAEDAYAEADAYAYAEDDEELTQALPARPSGGDDARDDDVYEHHVASEVEQTRSFAPLTPAGDEDTAEHERGETARPAAGPARTPDDEDSTAVIPPASQAANRRQSE